MKVKQEIKKFNNMFTEKQWYLLYHFADNIRQHEWARKRTKEIREYVYAEYGVADINVAETEYDFKLDTDCIDTVYDLKNETLLEDFFVDIFKDKRGQFESVINYNISELNLIRSNIKQNIFEHRFLSDKYVNDEWCFIYFIKADETEDTLEFLDLNLKYSIQNNMFFLIPVDKYNDFMIRSSKTDNYIYYLKGIVSSKGD